MEEFIELLEMEQARIRKEKLHLLGCGARLLARFEAIDARDKEIDRQIATLEKMPDIPEDQRVPKETLKLYALQRI